MNSLKYKTIPYEYLPVLYQKRNSGTSLSMTRIAGTPIADVDGSSATKVYDELQ